MSVILKAMNVLFSKNPISNLELGVEMSPWEHRPPRGIALVGNGGTIRAANGQIELSGYRKTSVATGFLRSTILAVAVPLEKRDVSISFKSVYRIRKERSGYGVQFDIYHDSKGKKMVESFVVIGDDAKMLETFLSKECPTNLDK